MVHVTDLLQLDSMKWAHTLAGVRGLAREVQWFDVLETPELTQDFREHSILLSTGYALKDNQKLQQEIIPRLLECNAAGLMIQTGRYLTPVPAIMVEHAEKWKIPLIELPPQAVFTDIISEGMRYLFARQHALLRRTEEIHRRLSEVVLGGGDLTQMAQALANLTQNTVIISDRDFRLMAYASWQEGNQERRRYQYQGKTLDQFLDNLEKTGFIQKIRTEKKSSRVEILFSKQGIQAWVVVPILIGEEIWGFIAVLEDYHRMRELEWSALEQACSIAAMAIYKTRSHEEMERRRKNELIFDVLYERICSDESIIDRAHSFGWQIEQSQLVLAMDIYNYTQYYQQRYQEPGEQHRHVIKEKLFTMLGSQITSRHRDMVVAHKEDIVVILLPLSIDSDQFAIREQIRRMYESIQVLFPDLEIRLGVSQVCCATQELPQAYREARTSLDIGKRIADREAIFYYNDLGVYQLLSPLQGSKTMRSFYQSMLGKFDALEEKQREELLKTLEVYFHANGNIHRAAEMLYMHRNSLTYRLNKIKEILQTDLDDAEVRFNLQLALKTRRFIS